MSNIDYHDILANRLIQQAYSRFLSVDQTSLTGVILKSVLDVYLSIWSDCFKILTPPLNPVDIDTTELGRVKLHILSKILGTNSFAFPSGSSQKYFGILDTGAKPPGAVSHGIPDRDPGGRLLPPEGNPNVNNFITVTKPEFRTLLIGQGLLKGGVINYNGLVRHVSSFLNCSPKSVYISVISPNIVEITATVDISSETAKIYNKFFIGAISHIGISITLKNSIL